MSEQKPMDAPAPSGGGEGGGWDKAAPAPAPSGGGEGGGSFDRKSPAPSGPSM
jgi:hypothetical protein